MMGRLRHEEKLFYSFSLEDVVPEDHLVRKIAAVLDLSWVYADLEPHYSQTGRPSIDPELMIRMLIIRYVFAIRSERLLCREVKVNMAYRWFCGLGLEDKIPDHSAFSRARNKRFRNFAATDQGRIAYRIGDDRVRASLHCGISLWPWSGLGQNPRLPHRNINGCFSSLRRHPRGRRSPQNRCDQTPPFLRRVRLEPQIGGIDRRCCIARFPEAPN
jgi:transposase